MFSIKDKIVDLTRMLFPNGRAFYVAQSGLKKKIHTAFAEVEKNVYNDSLSILYSILPDNEFFTEDDATAWEMRLGLITNTEVTLEDRKAAIIRKMNHPGDIPARQSRDYIENSLRLAGFDVYVYENPGLLSIEQILYNNTDLNQLGDVQLGDGQLGDIYSYYENEFNFTQLGDGQLGEFALGYAYFKNKIANYIDEQKYIFFLNSIETTFIVGGATFGSFAAIDANRKEELRQLILKLKPAHNVGYLLINYV